MKVKLALFTIVTLCAYSCLESKNNVGHTKPNILFILVDDLGYTDLGCMGSQYYETPNIDKIAAEGTLFTDAYAACQVCSPSRASILTGQFTARHGITDWIGAKSGEEWRTRKRYNKLLPAAYKHQLSTSYLTLPKALKAEGYATFFAGKWHIGGEGSLPEDHGFDTNIGGYHAGSPGKGGYFSPFKNPKLEDTTPTENLSIRLANETAQFIKADHDEPFLAYLSFYAVHGPIQSSKQKWEKYRAKSEAMGIADSGFMNGDLLPMRLHQDHPVYGGLVETMDDAVGIVLNALKETGLDQNTIVVFTSDNGGVVSGDGYATNLAPLKGGKGQQWEGGIRVPLLMSVPWIKNQVNTSNIPVMATDLYPTLLDLAGLPLQEDAHLDGKSIKPIIIGNEFEERPLYWHYPHYGNQGGRPVSIMRQGDWKVIHYWEDGHFELYNLKEDIHEDKDLSTELSDKAQQMDTQLLTWLKSVNAQYPTVDTDYDEVKHMQWVTRNKTKLKNWLEKSRADMLKEDWQPNKDWWESMQTVD
ncbi:sulfatase [Saccharicrinis aurantiacus]|uniref:sulfatase n=1 Tax=Saccharicrinis aurantiacus TaxID=1849719 RepID=UPI00094FC052|nr:sulfatase [Saccharicrinis aurantiacus]